MSSMSVSPTVSSPTTVTSYPDMGLGFCPIAQRYIQEGEEVIILKCGQELDSEGKKQGHKFLAHHLGGAVNQRLVNCPCCRTPLLHEEIVEALPYDVRRDNRDTRPGVGHAPSMVAAMPRHNPYAAAAPAWHSPFAAARHNPFALAPGGHAVYYAPAPAAGTVPLGHAGHNPFVLSQHLAMVDSPPPPPPPPLVFNDDEPIPVIAAPAVVAVAAVERLSVRIIPEYGRYLSHEPANCFSVVKIAAPEVFDMSPSDYVLVIDASSSMSGLKINTVKRVAELFVRNMRSPSRVAVVTFAYGAQKVFGLKVMTEGNKENIIRRIRQINAYGATDIVGGLDYSLRILRERRQENPTSSVLVLSDGAHNNNNSVLEDIGVAAARMGRLIVPERTRVDIIGIGRGTDVDFLTRITRVASGTFRAVEDDSQVDDVMGTTMAVLASHQAQNVRVEVTTKNGSHNIRPLIVSEGESDETLSSVRFVSGRMFAGQELCFPITFSIPAREAPLSEDNVLEVKLTYDTVRDPIETIEQKSDLFLERSGVVGDQEQNALCCDHRNRAKMLEALEEAQRIVADPDHLTSEGAIAALDSGIDFIRSSSVGDTEESIGFIDQLTQMKSSLVARDRAAFTLRSATFASCSFTQQPSRIGAIRSAPVAGVARSCSGVASVGGAVIVPMSTAAVSGGISSPPMSSSAASVPLPGSLSRSDVTTMPSAPLRRRCLRRPSAPAAVLPPPRSSGGSDAVASLLSPPPGILRRSDVVAALSSPPPPGSLRRSYMPLPSSFRTVFAVVPLLSPGSLRRSDAVAVLPPPPPPPPPPPRSSIHLRRSFSSSAAVTTMSSQPLGSLSRSSATAVLLPPPSREFRESFAAMLSSQSPSSFGAVAAASSQPSGGLRSSAAAAVPLPPPSSFGVAAALSSPSSFGVASAAVTAMPRPASLGDMGIVPLPDLPTLMSSAPAALPPPNAGGKKRMKALLTPPRKDKRPPQGPPPGPSKRRRRK